MTDNKKLVETLLRKTASGEFNADELSNVYRRIDSYAGISEDDRDSLSEAIEDRLRTHWPRKARSLFGAKDAVARKLLDQIWSTSTLDVNVSRNKHNNRVKAGGTMRRGENYVDVYISYRRPEGGSVRLNIIQATPASSPNANLYTYVVGGDFGWEISEPISNLDVLGTKFSEELRKLI